MRFIQGKYTINTSLEQNKITEVMVLDSKWYSTFIYTTVLNDYRNQAPWRHLVNFK